MTTDNYDSRGVQIAHCIISNISVNHELKITCLSIYEGTRDMKKRGASMATSQLSTNHVPLHWTGEELDNPW